MRGKAAPSRPVRQSSRITPAYAGKRGCRTLEWPDCRDHPRVCGEKGCCKFSSRNHSGSPPHVRGKDACRNWLIVAPGITPACAGKSISRYVEYGTLVGSPPHVRGKVSLPVLLVTLSGSPPHVRGKATACAATMCHCGITPACAGKRLKRSRSTVPPVAIVPLFPSVCNKPVVSDGSPAGRDAPLFLPAENAVPASPAYNLRSL